MRKTRSRLPAGQLRKALAKGKTDMTRGSPAKGQTSATKRRLEEIQLAMLSARLRELGKTRDVIRALGDDPDRYASQLAKQYIDLAHKRREPASLSAKSQHVRLLATLDRLAEIFKSWQYVIAPNATVELIQTPGTPDTGGSGIGSEIYQGEIAVGGEIWNASTTERWWVNTWQYIVPFPPILSTSAPGSLSYRFNVGAALDFYRQDVVTGSVHVYATVGTTNDLSNHPIDFNQPVSSDFAIVATLPTANVPPLLFGGANISGTIPLLPGGTPAIGVIIGLIISVVNGDVQLIPGEYGEISLGPPDATTYADWGKIEYRIDQPFWVDAVGQMLNS